MAKEKKGGGKWKSAVIIAAAVFIFVSILYLLEIFSFLEHKTYDYRVRLLAESSRPSDDIVLILLDQDSIDWAQAERGWGWPWPREAYGEIIDYISTGGAESLAFDVLFTEPSLYGAEDDERFIRAAADFKGVVQTVFFSSQTGNAYAWPADLNSPLFSLNNFDGIIEDFDLFLSGSGGRAGTDRRIAAQFPIRGLLDSAAVMGSVTGRADDDHIYRRSWLFTLFDGKAVPGLSSASLMAAGAGQDIFYNKNKRTIQWEDYSIPVDKDGGALLRFRGSLDRYFPYKAKAVLQSAEDFAAGREPDIFPEDFAGKYVFFGYYAPGLFDICSTPISSTYPGVGMHITMLDNILQRDFITKSPLAMDLLLILIFTVLVTGVVLLSGRIPLEILTLIIALGIIIGGGIGAYAAGYWLPMVAPIAGAVLAFLSANLYNYSTEGSQKRFIKSAFSQYLSPMVIDRLLADPGRLSLGGERREISIYFSDVQGFTTISEKLDPTKLTELLNNYLSFMSDIILDSGGTIDKYEGDAIIAFWNAPVDQEDHAARALGALLSCQEQLAGKQDFFEEKFGSRLITRIGMNTGYAVVGNMGSSKRFDYTMLGDSVNLAARLEGLNKQFGTYSMCSAATMEAAGKHGSFFGRELAKVAVVGKKEPVTVFEPMPEGVFAERRESIRRFDSARDLFYEGKFAEALPLFEALASEDQPSFFYAEQCRYYIKNPADWQGFWKATSK